MTNTETTGAVKITRTRTGTVTSDARDKTITVKVLWAKRHPQFGKVMQRHTTYHVHDESNRAKVGDQVVIQECRPVLQTKTWKLVDVLV